ncbi:MAG: DUF58 domain-containing protein [Halococcoides sp.]
MTDARLPSIGIGVAVLATATGIALQSTAITMIAVVGVAYATYGWLDGPIDPSLDVDRRIEPRRPRPRETVAVTLVVTNRGESVLTDVRIRESIPDSVRLIDGDTACCSSLRPGESVTLEYTIRASDGQTIFDPPAIECHSANGVRTVKIQADVETGWFCRATATDLPLAERTTVYTGQEETDAAGEGIEFHSLREYRPGDPPNRVDWNRLASHGRLRTIEFSETRAAAVVVVLDTTASTATARRPGEPPGRVLARQAAERVIAGLLDDHNRVGVACVGEQTGYLPPAAGREQALRAERLFDGEADGLDLDTAREVRRHLPSDGQVIVCSPLLDGDALGMARQFRAADHPVTLVSPDVTDPATVGGTVARIERRRRLEWARRSGVRAIDWPQDQPLERAIEAARQGWVR